MQAKKKRPQHAAAGTPVRGLGIQYRIFLLPVDRSSHSRGPLKPSLQEVATVSPPTQASALGHSYTIEEANNNPSTRCWRWRTVVGVGGGRRRVSRRTEERNAGRRSIVNRTAARGSRQNPRKKHPIPYSSAKRHGAQPRSRSADPAGRVPGLHTNGDHAVFSYVARSAVRDGMLEGFKLPRHTRTRFVRQARL